MKPQVIAVDFDGTCVDHRFPDVGPDVPHVVEVLRRLRAEGCHLVLWTMRSEEYLDHAVRWFAERDITLYGVNTNPTQWTWTSSPKAYANVYVDDAALGCPLIQPAAFKRPCVDWLAVEHILTSGAVPDAGPVGGFK